MKKPLFVFLFSMAASYLQANNTTPMEVKQAADSRSFANNEKSSTRVFIGTEFINHKWTYNNIDENDDLSLDMIGATIGIEHLQPSKIFWKLRLSHVNGKVSNDEWYGHDTTAEGNIGYTFSVNGCPKASITAFTGLNYYRSYSSVYDYHVFKLQSYYLPVGFILSCDVNSKWNVAFRAQANFPINNSLKIGSLKRDFAKKTCYEIELPLTYHMDKQWDINLIPSLSLNPHTNYTTYDGETSDWGKISAIGARIELGYTL